MNPAIDLGPLLVAPTIYVDVRNGIREVLGFPEHRYPLLIGVDGLNGSGKSSLASWLSWQLEMPAIHLDSFLINNTVPLSIRTADLARVLEERRLLGRPIIVEGVLLLRVLGELKRAPDFLLFVECEENHTSVIPDVLPYLLEFDPKAKANMIVRWSSREYDQATRRANIESLGSGER